MSRNDVFKSLASKIAATSLLMHEGSVNVSSRVIEDISVDNILNAPLMPHPNESEYNTNDLGKTVKETIVETIGKLGENITLRRVAVVSEGASAYFIHGGDATSGKIGGIAVLQPKKVKLTELEEADASKLSKAARQVARQVVGFNPTYLNSKDVPEAERQAQSNIQEFEETHVLNKQKYLLNPELTIAEHVEQTANAEVVDFIRWEVGEGIEKKENDFAEEVMNAARGN